MCCDLNRGSGLAASGLPRILMVGNFFASDLGAYQYCSVLAMQLEERGASVLRVSFKTNRVRRLADILKTVVARARDYDVALVDVFSGPAFLWAEMAAWVASRLRKPVVLTLHGGALPRFAARHPGRVRCLLQSAARVTAPSVYLSRALATYRPDIEVIPNAINLDRYPYRVRRDVRPAFVWLRALARDYRPEDAVETLLIIRRRYPEAKLLLVGPDKGDGTRDAVRAQVARFSLDDCVTMTGAIQKKDVSGVLNQGDIFLNTTLVDNTPVSLIEAMACGLCVISTNVGGLPYMLKDGRDALLVPPGSPGAMACAAERVLADPQLAARLSANARSTVEQFGWPAVFPMWERLFTEVLGGRGSGLGARNVGVSA